MKSFSPSPSSRSQWSSSTKKVKICQEHLPEWSDCSDMEGSDADSCFDASRASVGIINAFKCFAKSGDTLRLSIGITVCVVDGVVDDLEEEVALVERTVGDVGSHEDGLPDVGLDVEGLRDGLAEVGLFVGLTEEGLADVGLELGLFVGLTEEGLSD